MLRAEEACVYCNLLWDSSCFITFSSYTIDPHWEMRAVRLRLSRQYRVCWLSTAIHMENEIGLKGLGNSRLCSERQASSYRNVEIFMTDHGWNGKVLRKNWGVLPRVQDDNMVRKVHRRHGGYGINEGSGRGMVAEREETRGEDRQVA